MTITLLKKDCNDLLNNSVGSMLLQVVHCPTCPYGQHAPPVESNVFMFLSPVPLDLALLSTASPHHALCSLDMLYFKCFFPGFFSGVKKSVEDSISPQTDAHRAVEGAGVVLSCSYVSSVVSSLLWHRQYPGSPPQFLIMEYSGYITNPIPGMIMTHIKQ